MRRNNLVLVAAVVAVLAGTARPASADITAFLGFTPTTTSRGARGLAIGGGVMFFGFEFEYASISEATEIGRDGLPAPALKTGTVNLLLQTLPIAGVQIYGTGGGGYASESRLGVSNGHFVSDLGAGVKVRVFGPLRLRVDYRVFRLRGTPLVDTYHRFYAGANLSF
jgi:hypothetical protein